ncbi:hypothetical protein SFC88_01765 [Nocardioides sp. HM23]|uniref:hypothetical protein n=1 Tax=Nocardioides bizhenqiangii TaxID=3095076 RepID=UPI002ACAE462|nr:hypothetical protein [Nocardioides sp. HM23]MDZ5619532.1 hypothetical protein [Nocardioides sp. HM23]
MSQTPTTYQPYTPGRPGPEEAPRQPRTDGGPNCMVVASVVCVVVWAMSGFGYFWPIWVLLPTFLLGGGRFLPFGASCRRIERPKN